MEITRKQIGTTLIIALRGHLDALSAPTVDAEIRKGMEGITELYWDFSNLDYLTSAGFRELLIAEDLLDEGAAMKVFHANETVREAFYMTNLTSLLAD